MNKKDVLVIEDQPDHAEAIGDWLGDREWNIELATTGKQGIEKARQHSPDAVVLDIIMSTEDEGFEVLKALRDNPETEHIPVVIYSVRGDEMRDRIKGLRLGADYFLMKDERLAELEETLRRALRIAERPSILDSDPEYVSLYYDADGDVIWIDGEQRPEINLSRKQRRLMELLWKHRNEVCSRNSIADHVYDGQEEGITNQSIDRLVKRLRDKLDPDSRDRFIRAVYGTGYKLVVTRLDD